MIIEEASDDYNVPVVEIQCGDIYQTIIGVYGYLFACVD